MPDSARAARDESVVPRRTVLLLGATGQVGGDLFPLLHRWLSVWAPNRTALDLGNLPAVRDAIREYRPHVIVNAAAMTNVDAAESDPETARLLNAALPETLAEEAARVGALHLHFSTDFVFDGSATRPYREEDNTGPVNVYGRTKLEGEQAIVRIGAPHLILRTSWVYSNRGRNFFSTLSKLARERERLEVVMDQTGCPTASFRVAQVVNQILRNLETPEQCGIVHVAGGGCATRFEFAEAIVQQTHGARARVEPITSEQFPSIAARPRYSVLDTTKLLQTFGIALPHWTDDLKHIATSTAVP